MIDYIHSSVNLDNDCHHGINNMNDHSLTICYFIYLSDGSNILMSLADELVLNLIVFIINNAIQKSYDVNINIDLFIIKMDIDWSYSMIVGLIVQFV